MTEIILVCILIILLAAANLVTEDTKALVCAQAARDTIQVVAVRDSVLLECYCPEPEETE